MQMPATRRARSFPVCLCLQQHQHGHSERPGFGGQRQELYGLGGPGSSSILALHRCHMVRSGQKNAKFLCKSWTFSGYCRNFKKFWYAWVASGTKLPHFPQLMMRRRGEWPDLSVLGSGHLCGVLLPLDLKQDSKLVHSRLLYDIPTAAGSFLDTSDVCAADTGYIWAASIMLLSYTEPHHPLVKFSNCREGTIFEACQEALEGQPIFLCPFSTCY